MSHSRPLKVGVFVVAGITTIIAALIVFADWRFWRQRQDYLAYFPYSVSGLSVGSRVELWGVQIGDVHSIAFDGDAIRVVMRMEGDVRVPMDAKAALKFEGLTGLKFIDIEGGQLGGPALAEGGEIAVAPDTLREAIDSALAALDHVDSSLGKLDLLMEDVSELFGEANREQFARVLEGAERTVSSTSTAAADIRVITSAIRRTAPDLLSSWSQSSENLALLSEQGKDISRELAAAARDGRRTLGSLAQVTRTTGNEIRAALFEIRATASSARSFMRNLEESPSMLLFAEPQRELLPP